MMAPESLSSAGSDSQTEESLTCIEGRLDKTSTLSFAPVIENRWELKRALGRGGASIVYEARDLHLGREVALKIFRLHEQCVPELGERFRREASISRRVKSPHIVTILETGTIDGDVPVIAMERLEGVDLSGLIEREGPLDPLRAIDLTLQAGEGIAALHSAGVIHRDIKPSNLFLVEAGNEASIVKILDFGLARDEHNPEEAIRGKDSPIAGTPMYVAPELLTSDNPGDRCSDVYSLGIVLYALLTARSPFQGDSRSDVLMAVARGSIVMPKQHGVDLDPALERVLLKAMAHDRTERYRNVAGFLDALRSLRSYRRSHRNLRRSLVPESKRRWLRPLGLGLVLAALLGALLGLSVATREPESRSQSLESPTSPLPNLH